MPGRRNILIVDNSPDVTGAFKSIFALTKTLREKFIFHFAIKQGSSIKEVLVREGVSFIEIPFLEIGRNLRILNYFPMLIINARRALAYCKEKDIAIIHVNDLYNMIGVVMKIMQPGIKAIYHIRLLPDSFAGKLYAIWKSIVLRYADEVIVVSKAVGQAIDKPGSRKKVTLIYDFIPLQENLTVAAAHPSAVIFLYPANYIRGKGQDYALRAFAALTKLIGDCRLQFIGGDLGLEKNRHFRRHLQRESDRLGLSHCVSFEDWNDDVEQLMKSSDIILNFSESESFSLVCYEAMVFGRPIISTDCGGPGEMIEDQVSGLLVPNRDVEAMTKAMFTLASKLSFRKTLGESAATLIRNKRFEHNASQRLESIYSHPVA